MLRVTQSNWMEALLEALGSRLARDPFVSSTVIVPNRAMERVVELALARQLGVVANVRFARLERWLEEELGGARNAEPAVMEPAVMGGRELTARVLAALSEPALADLAPDDPLAPLSQYLLAGDGRWGSAPTDRRRLELAPRLGRLLLDYAYSRPDWLRAWAQGQAAPDDGPNERVVQRWQAALYRRVRAMGTALPSLAELLGARLHPNAPRADATNAPRADGGPRGPVHVLGLSYVTPVVRAALVEISRTSDVELFVLNPCRELWSDVAPRSHARAEDAPGDESSLLVAWGRPGREHVAAIDEASGFAAERRFVDPTGAATTHLARVQRSILERAHVPRGEPDGSLVVMPCPSVRREVESVVSIVWGLVAEADARARAGESEPLRLPEIAILVPPRELTRYLPHLETSLSGLDGGDALPWSGQDLTLASRSRVAEACLRLLRFFEATPTRRGMLSLVSHPLVRPRGTELEGPEERSFAGLLDDVGIVRGIDERDLRGTYADRASGEGSVLHFDQGLSRLARGAVEADPTMLDEAPASRAPRLDPEPVAAFLTLARSLLADHRALDGARLSLRSWAAALDALLAAYVRPAPGDGAEESELARCRAAVRSVAELEVSGIEAPLHHGAVVALGLAARAIEEIPATRGEPHAVGVCVAPLVPMRPVPYRAVFVLGLGEGHFPEEGLELGLDLRRAKRRAGDVSSEDRDRYAFLETLVSTRERLVLSYVARDEHTGDPLAPSSILHELCEAAGAPLEIAPPARRHEDIAGQWCAGLGLGAEARAAMASALGAAVGEHEARARGDRERRHFRDLEIATDAWAQLADDDPRRPLLALPALPRAELDEARTVRVRTVRAFLACPLQGRALHWLREREEDEDRALRVEEEPLDTDGRALDVLARAALHAALERGLGPEPRDSVVRAVEEVVGLERAAGRVPIGALGAEVASDVMARAERWLETLTEARPGVQVAQRVRFGPPASQGGAREQARQEPRTALVLGASAPPGSSPARHASPAPASSRVTLEGATHPLLRSEPGAPGLDVLRLLGSSASGEGERARLARGRAAIEAYLDHAILAASGDERVPRRALLLTPEGAYETSLPALGREQAARWVRALADEIRAVDAPGWFLPVEAVVLESEPIRRGDPRLAEKLLKAIERVRTKHEGGSSRFGPLRDAVLRDAPEARDVVGVVARRYALPLSAMRPPARAGAAASDLGLLR